MNEPVRSKPFFVCDARGSLGAGAVIHDRYRVLGVIGSGGMGEVYEAEHVRLGTRVAIKVLRTAGDESASRQLLREARLTARLVSDEIVRVFDSDVLADGSPYVVMERLFGEDLGRLLARETQLPVQRALQIALQVCDGLADLHAAGIVHRDLKPANVFVLRPRGNSSRCKLLDLGIARSLSGDTTRSTLLAGSVRYMAPELLSNATQVTELTDVYAAAAILYQCLTGTVPHPGETMEVVMHDILNRPVRPAIELRPELSNSLSSLISSALTRDVTRRPQSAMAFGMALARFLVRVDDGSIQVGASESTVEVDPIVRTKSEAA